MFFPPHSNYSITPTFLQRCKSGFRTFSMSSTPTNHSTSEQQIEKSAIELMSPRTLADAVLKGDLDENLQSISREENHHTVEASSSFPGYESSSVSQGTQVSAAVTVSAKASKTKSSISSNAKNVVRTQLESLYAHVSNEHDLESANDTAKTLFTSTIESLLQYGSSITQENDSLRRKIALLDDALREQENDTKRLKNAETNNRETIAVSKQQGLTKFHTIKKSNSH